MTEPMRIRKIPGKWVVRAGGAVIGETANALELSEEGKPDVILFPRSDVAMAFLEKSSRTSESPAIGEATHYSIVTKSTTLTDAAWSFESPASGAERLAGHIAFASEKATVEQL